MTLLVCVYKNCRMHYSSLPGQKAWKKDMPNLFTIELYISWYSIISPLIMIQPPRILFTLYLKKNTTPKMLNISKTKYRNHGKLELFYVHNKPDSSDSPPLR